jgi:hypothetical protein
VKGTEAFFIQSRLYETAKGTLRNAPDAAKFAANHKASKNA